MKIESAFGTFKMGRKNGSSLEHSKAFLKRIVQEWELIYIDPITCRSHHVIGCEASSAAIGPLHSKLM